MQGVGRVWTPEELTDLRNLTQVEYRSQYPDRTDRAYYCKMNDLGIEVKSHDAVVKAKRMFLNPEQTPHVEEPDFDKILTLMQSMQAETRKLDTSMHDVSITIDTKRPIGIVPIADTHIGSEDVDYDQIKRDFYTIRDNPYLYMYWGGDAVDNFVLEKMIAASRSQAIQVPYQWFLFEGFLKNMAGSILAIGAGNHDNWTKSLVGIDRVADIAKRLQLVYTGQGGMIRLTVGKQTYKIFRRHRFRYNSSFNVTHTVKRMYEQCPEPFDVGITEHYHRGGAELFMAHGRNRVAIVCGTYKIWDKWARDQGFYNSNVFAPAIVFYPDEFRYELRTDLQQVSKDLMPTKMFKVPQIKAA